MEMTKESVAQKVRERLAESQSNGLRLAVTEADIRKVDDWWRVPVHPSHWPKKMHEFYEILAQVEGDIQEQDEIDVILFTGDPLEEQEALAA